MKRTATLMLIAVTLLYVLARHMQSQAAFWGYVAAFAEAGMIGAVADWFAVVALFRHPLGIPIPHTAIIPANRERIAIKLADFLCNKFIDTEQIAKHLGIGDPTRIAARWLAQPTNARKVAGAMCRSIEHILPLLSNERLKTSLRQQALQAVASTNLGGISTQILQTLVDTGKHQKILDGAVLQLGQLLINEEVRNHIAAAVAKEVRYLRYIGLDEAAGRYATTKIIAVVANLMEEMAQDPDHPFRQRFDQYVCKLLIELETHGNAYEQVQRFQQTLARQPALAQAFDQLWGNMLQWLRDDCAKSVPTTQNHLEQALQTVARQLQASEDTRQWLNQKIFDFIPAWITRYRPTIRRYIVNTVNAWTPEEMSRGIEQYVGRDLQFIRINGTLVGGFVGLLIYTITHGLGV